MTRIYQLFFAAATLMLAMASCQRVIDLDIRNVSPQLVIEGNLTNVNGPQLISISNTVPYSNTNVYPPVSGAVVTVINNEGLVYNFKETTAGQYIGTLRGRAGVAYTLKVALNGQAYTATSVMPATVNLDSLGLSSMILGKKEIKTIVVYYHDPPNMPNQYRFIMYVNGALIKQIYPLNDAGTDGRVISTILYQNDIDLLKGDKVEIEMQCLDFNMYQYWLNLSQQGGNSPSSSTTPSNPTSNLSNGALGYFSAHTTQKKSVVIP